MAALCVPLTEKEAIALREQEDELIAVRCCEKQLEDCSREELIDCLRELARRLHTAELLRKYGG